MNASAQVFESLGTRALGMGGAFVAVADDATAVYWNPAGLATGAFVSVVAEWQAHEARRSVDTLGGGSARESTTALLAMGTPPLGLAYYRLRSSTAEAQASAAASGASREAGSGAVELASLVTHHWAATLVQTVVEGVTVGASVKVVRGVAADDVVSGGRALATLAGEAASLDGAGTTRGDVDLGAMWATGRLRVGLVARNLTAPTFRTPSGRSLALDRQVRVGMAVVPVDGAVLAIDADLTRTTWPEGARRMVALGGERVWRDGRVAIRGGVRANTLDEARPSGSAGFTVALAGGAWLDGYVSRGGDGADRGWGLSARIGF